MIFMDKLLYLIVIIGITQATTYSQSKDMAEIRNDGIQVPVVDHDAVINPVRGLLVYDNITDSYWYHDGGQWWNVGSKSTQLIDADGDTGVGVEQFADADEITFDVRGRTALELREIPGISSIIQFRTPEFNSGNIFFGNNAGEKIDSINGAYGSDNTVIGMDAGSNLTTGSSNTIIGFKAGEQTQSSISNTLIGTGAGFSNVGSYNTFVGNDSGGLNVAASGNTYLGAGAGFHNKNGVSNVYIGLNTGSANLDGFNTFVGESVAYQLKNGGENTMVGARAADKVISGENNVYLGSRTGENNEGGDRNVFIGYAAGTNYGLSPEPAVSDILAIANNRTTSPLIYGEFNNGFVRINELLQLPPITINIPACNSAIDEGFIYLDGSNLPQKLKVCVKTGAGGASSDWAWQDLN